MQYSSFSGTVVHGEKIGRTLGFPTANLSILRSETKLSSGVYAAYVNIDQVQYEAALIIMDTVEKVEVYILGEVVGDLYDEILVVKPMTKVSEIVLCSTEELLKEKIVSDVEKIKEILSVQ